MSMSLKSPATKFIGILSQESPRRMRPGKVPFREPEGRSTSAKIGDRKKRQLESLLQREKDKERRERVAYVLIQKLIFKFGSKYTSIITFFVEEYFNSHTEISSDELSALEGEIRNAIRAAINQKKNDNAANANRTEDGQSSAQQNNQADDAGEANRRPASTGKEWQMIQIFQSIQDEEKIRWEQEQARLKKLAFRKALDDQRNQSRRQNSAELEDERRYVEHILGDIDRYHAEELRKREVTKKKYQDELLIRKAQIEDQQRRLQAEKDELRRIEQRNLELLQEEARREQEAIQRARQLEKEKMERIKKENEENKRLRQLEKEREAAEDHRLMQEYAAKLDRESKERDEAFSKRMKEMELHGMKFENEGAGKALREEQLRFEQQLLREQQRKAEEDRRQELLKEEERRRRLQLALNDNRRLLEQRQKEQEDEKKRDAMMAEQFRREMEELRRQEEEKRQNHRAHQEEYRRRLDQQRDEWNRRDRNLNDITVTEKRINRDTLVKIANPQTMSKVMHRIRMDSARAKSAK